MILKRLLVLVVLVASSSAASASDLTEVKSSISTILKGLNSRAGDPSEAQIAQNFWLTSPYGDSYPCVIEVAQTKKTTIKYKVTENTSTKYTFDLMRVKNVSVVGPMKYSLNLEAEENRIQHSFEDYIGNDPRVEEMVSEFRYDVTSEAAEKIVDLLNEAVEFCK